MIALLTNPLFRWAGGALAILAVMGGIYLKGRADGSQAVMDRLAADRITILKDNQEIDHEVLRADDTGLCALLGGCELPDDADRN